MSVIMKSITFNDFKSDVEKVMIAISINKDINVNCEIIDVLMDHNNLIKMVFNNEFTKLTVDDVDEFLLNLNVWFKDILMKVIFVKHHVRHPSTNIINIDNKFIINSNGDCLKINH